MKNYVIYFLSLNVRNVFKMNTIGNYHDLYLRTEI